MQKKYYNSDPEGTAGGGGVATNNPVPNFAALTEQMFQPDYKPEAINKEKEIEAKNEEDIKNNSTELEVKPEEKKEGEVEKPVVEEKKEESTDLKLDGVEETKAAELELKLDEPVQNKNIWIETAKETLGIDLQEDSPEAFKLSVKNAIEAAKEEGKKTTLDQELASLNPEAAVDFILLREGLTRDEINAPVKELEDLLALSNIDLVRKDLELQYKDLDEHKRNELIEKEIEILTEKELIDHEAEKLKVVLNQAKESRLLERAELAKSVATKYEAKREADRQSELQSIGNSLNTVKEFMGSPINDNVRTELVKRISYGKFDSIFNDPAKKAQFILFDLFGEQAAKNIRQLALTEGREKVTKHLSNVPPDPKHNNSVSSSKQSAKTASGFEALETLFGQ